MGQLLGRVQNERLLASGEVHVQVFDAVRRLDGHGEAERQVVILAAAAPALSRTNVSGCGRSYWAHSS